MVATLDPLRQLDLLRRRQQADLADLLQKELQRVGRDLARLRDRLLLLGERCDDDRIHRANRPDNGPGRRQDVTGAGRADHVIFRQRGRKPSIRMSYISFTSKPERKGSVPLYIRALVETQNRGSAAAREI
jgi:hypothetical protein